MIRPHYRVEFKQEDSTMLPVIYREEDLDILLDDIQLNAKEFDSTPNREAQRIVIQSLRFGHQQYTYINNRRITYFETPDTEPRNYINQPYWLWKQFYTHDVVPDYRAYLRTELGHLAAVLGTNRVKTAADADSLHKDLLMMADRGMTRMRIGNGSWVEYHGPHPASPSPTLEPNPVEPPVAEPAWPIMSAEDSDANEYFIILNLVSGTVTQIPMHNILEATQVIYKLFVDLELCFSQIEIYRDIDAISKHSREIKQYSNKILMFCTNRD